jgi:hypothetical protein
LKRYGYRGKGRKASDLKKVQIGFTNAFSGFMGKMDPAFENYFFAR